MPKNRERYRYFDVGLALTSWTLAKLEADAELHQMDDMPAKLIALRLTEYYRLMEASPLIPNPSAGGGALPEKASASPTTPRREEPPPKAAPSEPDAADDCADEWGTLDTL